MNRIDRLTAILIQLQSKKWVTSVEIADRFEISQRTVYRDIRALEEAGIPLFSEPGRGYSLVEGYHLPPVMFSPEEAGAVLIAEKLVEKLTDSSVQKHFLSAVMKIKAVLPESSKNQVEKMEEHVAVFSRPVTERDGYPNNFLSEIQQALVKQKCVNIDYDAYYSREMTKNRIVDPHGLVYYGNCWHLIGYCHLRQEMRDFRLDRILRLQITDKSSTEKQKGQLREYLTSMWRDSDLTEVTVWFDNSVVSSLTNAKFYFGFIDETPESNGVEMHFGINDLVYFAHWVLSFGDKIKIIEPDELKNIAKNLVRNLAALYLPENIAQKA